MGKVVETFYNDPMKVTLEKWEDNTTFKVRGKIDPADWSGVDVIPLGTPVMGKTKSYFDDTSEVLIPSDGTRVDGILSDPVNLKDEQGKPYADLCIRIFADATKLSDDVKALLTSDIRNLLATQGKTNVVFIDFVV